MKINEIKIGLNDISLKAKVLDVSEPRSVRTKFGYQTTVAKATLEDETGKISLSLWGKDIEKVGEGDTVEIKNGYVSEFMGELQLNVPKSGEINISNESAKSE